MIVYMKKIESVRAFVGYSKNIYTVTIETNRKYFVFPKIYDDGIGSHNICLNILLDLINLLNNVSLLYYPNQFDISYEYNEKMIDSPETKDKKLWKEILTQAKIKNISLTINGEDSLLSGVGKINA